jgi:hypothetical protein
MCRYTHIESVDANKIEKYSTKTNKQCMKGKKKCKCFDNLNVGVNSFTNIQLNKYIILYK